MSCFPHQHCHRNRRLAVLPPTFLKTGPASSTTSRRYFERASKHNERTKWKRKCPLSQQSKG